MILNAFFFPLPHLQLVKAIACYQQWQTVPFLQKPQSKIQITKKIVYSGAAMQSMSK